MKEYREPSTLKINRENKQKAKERLQSLGITLEGFVAKAWDFATFAKSDEIYLFMKNNTKKLLVILFFSAGVYVGYRFADVGKMIYQAVVDFEIIDRVR